MNERQMQRADFITSIVLIAFGVSVLVLSIQMPRLENKNINPYTVPGIVPGFLGAIITLLALILFVRSLRQRGFQLGITRQTASNIVKNEMIIRLFLTLALCLVYALLLVGWLPYIPATLIFVFVFIMIFEYQWGVPLSRQVRTILMGIVEATLVSVIVAMVFEYLFLVKLP